MPPEGHPSLPGWIEDAYFPLSGISATSRIKTPLHIVRLLTSSPRPTQTLEMPISTTPLSYLLDHGWLYEVDGQLFVTEFHESESE